MGYTVKQLLKYHRHCLAAAPESRVCPPGGRAGWDDLSAREWLQWFSNCLMRKCSRGLEFSGKGNRATKRMWQVRKDAVRCHECGCAVGERTNPNASHNYCDGCRGNE